MGSIIVIKIGSKSLLIRGVCTCVCVCVCVCVCARVRTRTHA
jgi:hypothetical protein